MQPPRARRNLTEKTIAPECSYKDFEDLSEILCCDIISNKQAVSLDRYFLNVIGITYLHIYAAFPITTELIGRFAQICQCYMIAVNPSSLV